MITDSGAVGPTQADVFDTSNAGLANVRRPQGSNADEWLIYLKTWGASPMCAVQIAEAIDAAQTNLKQALNAAILEMKSVRVFVTSRERVKCPEGSEFYDEVIAECEKVLGRAV